MEAERGTFDCPICGRGTAHRHEFPATRRIELIAHSIAGARAGVHAIDRAATRALWDRLPSALKRETWTAAEWLASQLVTTCDTVDPSLVSILRDRLADAGGAVERCPFCETEVAISPSGRFVAETPGGATHDADSCRRNLVKARDDYKRVAESCALLLAVARPRANAPRP